MYYISKYKLKMYACVCEYLSVSMCSCVSASLCMSLNMCLCLHMPRNEFASLLVCELM